MVRRSVRRRRNHNLNVIALACVGIGLAVTSFSFSRTPQAAEAVPQIQGVMVGAIDTIELPVLAQGVPAGTRVSTMRFVRRKFPIESISKTALSSTESINDWVSNVPLGANLPLERTYFRSPESFVNPVVAKIPDGMRAMTIQVDATAVVEGWAGSGNRVDVLLVERDRTSVIAEMVQILSTERSTAPVTGEGGAPGVPSTVTLLVSQPQLLAINTAIPKGRIAFALRNFKDDGAVQRRTFMADELHAGPAQQMKPSSRINGYVEYREGDQKRGFALEDNRRWIPSDAIPEGVLVGKNPDGSLVPVRATPEKS